MAAPVWAATGAIVGANSTAAAIDIPFGVVGTGTDPGEVIAVWLYVEGTPALVVTPSSGFAEALNSPAAIGTGSQQHSLHAYWKRASGPESGTYPFSIAAGLTWRAGYAVRYTGCVATGNPWETFSTAARASSDTAASPSPAVSGTTTGIDRLLVMLTATWQGRPITQAAGFTHRAQNTVEFADLAQPAAGSTGSLQSTWTGGTSSSTVWLGALLPVGATGGGGGGGTANQFFAIL